MKRRDALLAGAAFAVAPTAAGAVAGADAPAPFGVRSVWFVVRSANPVAVARELDLKSLHRAEWQAGVNAMYDDYGKGEFRAVFVSPPASAWVFAVGWGLLRGERRPHEDVQRFMIPLRRLIRLSRRFGEAQFYSSHHVVEAHAWARARAGVVERAYAYVGDRGEVATDIGTRTAAERGIDLAHPSEFDVFRIAGTWSLDPMHLDRLPAARQTGLLGTRLGAM